MDELQTNMTEPERETEPPSPDVYLEAHGVPGTAGRPAADLGRSLEPGLFDSIFWIADASRTHDLRVGFRATFVLDEPARVSIDLQASSLFRAWIDLAIVAHGPLRYAAGSPEYSRREVELAAGVHSLTIEAVDEGIATRSSIELPAFVFARVLVADHQIELDWRGMELTEFGGTGLRTSPLLGWMEWQSTASKADWRIASDTDDRWRGVRVSDEAVAVLGSASRSELDLPAWPIRPMHPTSSGHFRDTFSAYDLDDPAVQFLLADDQPKKPLRPDGIWARYDLGKVRIGTAEFVITTSRPAAVTVCYAEKLTPDGRPSPVVAMSTGPTRMLQKFRVGPGLSEIAPLQSLGGRYIEIRIETDGEAQVVDASFRERDLLGEPRGSFRSGIPELDAIWRVGIETLRSSAEDALVDSVRERGEWLGDVVGSALQIIGAGWGDTSLVRRALLHAAAAARPDGIVAGCGPGELIYLGTYAAQWVTACVQIAEAELSNEVLHQYEDAARANVKAIVDLIDDTGRHTLPWCFVDWGYSSDPSQPDAAVLGHVALALRSWIRWLRILGRQEEIAVWQMELDRIASLQAASLEQSPSPYHAYTLAALSGAIPVSDAVPHLLDRLRRGFPFDPEAERLKSPLQAGPMSVTPYFTNYSMPLLLSSGRGVEVLELWLEGWGWMLAQGATTWWEVFDDRWSHCHYWSASPTWQLSRFVLGLRPDLEFGGYVLEVNTLGMTSAEGTVPLAGGALARVAWEVTAGQLRYELDIDHPFSLVSGTRLDRLEPGTHTFTLHARSGDLYVLSPGRQKD